MKGNRNLRIAMMLESDGPGGAEMMVFRLSEELRRRGHVVVPVGPKNGVGWLGDLFREAGVTPETFSLRRPVDPACVRDLAKLFRSLEIDAVHSHEFTMAVYGAAAARLIGIPHVITMHGGFKACKVLRRRVALRWAMRNSNSTVMVSAATRRQFSEELGVDEGRFAVVPNGVPYKTGDAARVRAELGVRPNECVLLAVGNLERHKGHMVLLQALSRLKRSGVNVPWRLIIAGGRGGAEHEALVEYIEEDELEGRVNILTGRNDVHDLLALADVFVMPSLWEGLPMALLEAMMSGKAIVASATAGIPEAIHHSRDGLLVPPADVGQLTEALKQLITSPERRVELGSAARARANREFSIEVMTSRYEALYSGSDETGRVAAPQYSPSRAFSFDVGQPS